MKTGAILFLLFLAIFGSAQNRVFNAHSNLVQIKRSDRAEIENWSLSPELNPDVFTLAIHGGKEIRVTYLSPTDSISFQVNSKSIINFTILNQQGSSCAQQIKGIPYVPKAEYPAAFRKAKQGKTDIRIPEVYELVSILIALSPTGQTEDGLVNKDSPYYLRMNQFFSPFAQDTIVQQLDQFMQENGEYSLRTNAFAFHYDQSGKIVKSKVYNRITYTEDEPNYLEPFIPAIQQFAAKSKFQAFYQKEQAFYQTQIGFFEDSLNYKQMIGWLEKQFPSTRYDYHNILFSPLTGYNQGMIWFNTKGFNELQPHVNFPYPIPANLNIATLSKKIVRGNILFTELNHGYVNKETIKYAAQVNQALNLKKRDQLISPEKGKGYYSSPMETFNEYMNWALVAIRYLDFCDQKDLQVLIERNEKYMLRRGFTQFPAFQKFIIKAYQQKRVDQTLADLFPQLIQWFEQF